MRSLRLEQHAPLLLVVTLLMSAACETPLDALPADTVAILDLAGGEGPRPVEGSPLFASLTLDSSGCIALPETASFTLNGLAPEWQELGGRGRDPFSAFSPDCMWPQATWNLPSSSAPFVFQLEDEGTSLVAEIDEEGAITRCDFPACERPPVFRPL